MPRIIAYTHDADVHCPACTRAAAAADHPRGPLAPLEMDEHGLPIDLIDREGNPVRPVFSTDETEATHCGDCGARVHDDFADIKPREVPQTPKRIHDPWGLLNLG